jgi:tetratricopeptide (TPR) repeat protein
LVYQALHTYKRALEAYDQLVRLLPANPEGYFRRGHIHMLIRQFPEALSDLETALELKPTHVDARLDYGVILSEMGEYEQALRELNAVLQLQPSNAVIYYYQAQIYQKLGKRELAEAALTSFLGLSDHPIWTQRARIELENLQQSSAQNPTRIQLKAEEKDQIRNLVKSGKKAEALKQVVALSGASLMTAKAYLDWLIQEEAAGGEISSNLLSNM